MLELPRHPGPAERELNTKREAGYIIAVKNPTAPTPSNTGLSPDHEARFPKHLLEKFAGRRWVAVDPPDFLDYEGTELVLIGARENAEEELGIASFADRQGDVRVGRDVRRHGGYLLGR